ncbi:MAG: peptide deformylase [Armatimonadota bacterium]
MPTSATQENAPVRDPDRRAPALPPFDDSRVVKYRETAGWEVLRAVAEPVTEFGEPLRALVAEMADIMLRAHGCGLAAPQIGKSIRLCIYDAGDGLQVLVNPKVIKTRGGDIPMEEGCLSIPGLRGTVLRPNVVTLRAWDTEGRDRIFKATEFEARVIQHELDHLDGVLFIDKADPKSLHMLTQQEIDEEHAPVE